MKALSLHQPWASVMATGLKSIETRSWSTKHRGWVAICSAKRPPRNGEGPGHVGRDGLGNIMYWLPEPWTEEEQVARGLRADGDLCGFPLPLGAVVGVGRLVDVVPIGTDDGDELPRVISELSWGDYTPGRWAWIFDSVRGVYPPIPCKGRQGLWSLPDDVATEVEAGVALHA